MATQINNKLIAKNTFILYLRMLFTLGVSLFATRELLRILGVEDFGLYNVVGGVVLMFGFLNNAMIASSQRFISFALGEGDFNKQKLVFSTSILIHIIIAITILTLAETVGLWFLKTHMTIPEGRVEAVNWVYQAAIASFIIQIIQVPFSSTVIAHERMPFFALISILDSTLKLIIVYILTLSDFDRLKLYAILLLGISLLDISLYFLYTRIKFQECRFFGGIDRSLFKDMLSFAGWSFVGNFGFAAKDYGVNILLNIFSGPTVNAARGLAYQVMNAVSGFVANFQTAMNPQITKRYATGEVSSMISLVKVGSRYSFYLLAIIIIPLYIRAEYVLNLWLSEVPSMTLQFMRLTLIMGLINSMFGPLVTAIQATGKIKVFQITIAVIMSLDLPVSYFLLKSGMTPYSVMYVAIITAFVGLIARAILLNYLIKIDLRDFFFNVVFRNMLLAVTMYIPVAIISKFISQSFIGLIFTTAVSVICSVLIIYLSLPIKEKNTILNFVFHKKN